MTTCRHPMRRIDEEGICERCGQLAQKQPALTVRPVQVPEGRTWRDAQMARNASETAQNRFQSPFSTIRAHGVRVDGFSDRFWMTVHGTRILHLFRGSGAVGFMTSICGQTFKTTGKSGKKNHCQACAARLATEPTSEPIMLGGQAVFEEKDL